MVRNSTKWLVITLLQGSCIIAYAVGDTHVISYQTPADTSSTSLTHASIQALYHNNKLFACGKIKSENLLDSTWTFWYASGNIMAKGDYINGSFDGNTIPVTGRQGKWVTYFDNGKIKSIENWNNGQLHGKSFVYNTTGTPKQVDTYINGIKNGESFIYYENKQLKARGYFRNGEPDSTWVFYYRNGNKKATGHYNGSQHCPFSADEPENTCMEGEWIFYYETGQKKCVENWLNGNKNGVWVTWLDNGDTLSVTSYLLGKKNGISKTWNEGILAEKVNFSNGQKNGVAIYIKPDSTIIECNYRNDVLDGYYIENNKMSETKTEGTYFKGYKDGVWKETSGAYLLKLMTYKNGFLDGPYEGYSYNHYKLVARGNFVLDKPDGDWQYFYTNGKEKARGFYNAGKLIGNWQIYFNTDPDKEGVFDYPSLPVKKDVDPIEQFIYSALTLPDFSLNLEETDGYIELKINGNNMLSENVTGKYADGKPWFEKRREGRKIIFKKYYPDGTLHFEMEQAEEDKANVFMPEPFYKLISYWDEHGNQTVSTGNGEAVFYEADRHPQRNTYVNGRKVL